MVKTIADHPLKVWRKSAGKTQAQCAALVDVARHTWMAWERGRQMPTPAHIAKIKSLTGGKVRADDLCPQLDEAA